MRKDWLIKPLQLHFLIVFSSQNSDKIKNKNIWGFDGIVFKRQIHHPVAWFVIKYLHNQCILYVVLTLRKRLYLNSYSLMHEKALFAQALFKRKILQRASDVWHLHFFLSLFLSVCLFFTTFHASLATF